MNLSKSPALAIHHLFTIYIFPTDGHTPPTKCLLLLTHPHSSILPSIFFTCLSSNHIFTYTRPHIYPTNLPNPNITSLTSSFNSSQLPASHTSTTSSQISFILNPNSPASFLKHPQYFISLLLSSIHCLIYYTRQTISIFRLYTLHKKRAYPAFFSYLFALQSSSSSSSRLHLHLSQYQYPSPSGVSSTQ